MSDKVDAAWEALKVAIIDKAPSDYPEAVMAVSRHRPLIEAAIRTESEATVAALRADWIDHLPGITHVGNVTFGELMVPVSAIREHFRAALAATPEAERAVTARHV